MDGNKTAVQKKYVIGIDIGGTHFRIGAVDTDCQVHAFRKVRVMEVFYSEDVLKDLEEYLRSYMEEGGLTELVSAISLGFPATINRERTVVLQAPNVSYMENLPVCSYLQNCFGLPVYLDRDVCMTMHYDMQKLGIPKEGILIGCYFGTGIGNVICIDGKPILGKDGVAGELGHIPVVGSRKKCGCGNTGCMENLAGGKYLAKLCLETYTDTPVAEIFTRHGEEPLLRDFVERIAITVATEINILNPDYIIVGGGVPNMKDFPLARLEEMIRYHTRKPYPEKSLKLFFVEDADYKSVVGAGIYPSLFSIYSYP